MYMLFSFHHAPAGISRRPMAKASRARARVAGCPLSCYLPLLIRRDARAMRRAARRLLAAGVLRLLALEWFDRLST
jgi:hypothetical protein